MMNLINIMNIINPILHFSIVIIFAHLEFSSRYITILYIFVLVKM